MRNLCPVQHLEAVLKEAEAELAALTVEASMRALARAVSAQVRRYKATLVLAVNTSAVSKSQSVLLCVRVVSDTWSKMAFDLLSVLC